MDILDPKYIHRTVDRNGNIIEYDMRTGKAIAVNHPKEIARERFEYTLQISDYICALIRQGDSLASICRREGMPNLGVIYNWRRLHPDFGEKIDAAKKDRAEHFVDRVIDELPDIRNMDKDAVPAAKLYVDTAMKLAEKHDPDRWGNKVQLRGDKDSPLQIVVDTGILRPGDPGYNEEGLEELEAEFTRNPEIEEAEVVDPELEEV